MEIMLEIRCQGCGKLYAQAGKDGDRTVLKILGGIHADRVHPPGHAQEHEGLMLCSCGQKTPIDLRMFDDVPMIERGEPGWRPI